MEHVGGKGDQRWKIRIGGGEADLKSKNGRGIGT